MTTLLDVTIPRTLEELVIRFSAPEWRGCKVETWLFEDRTARLAAEQELASFGVEARFRSAYKPLVHAWLEDSLIPGAIALPCHPSAAKHRFTLEAYPLMGLQPGAWSYSPGHRELEYVTDSGMVVFAPNRKTIDPHGAIVLSACGWLRVRRDSSILIDEAIATEFEQAFDVVMRTITGHPWPNKMPFFNTLHIEIQTCGIRHELGVAHECIDTGEALHEDLYFSIIEFFQRKAGLPRGDRSLQPGQIVPEILPKTGATRVRICLVPSLSDVPEQGPMALERAKQAPDISQIGATMQALAGSQFTAKSVQGRSVYGLHRDGDLPGIVVTAGQHANETSGVVGLLRAAQGLLDEPRANIALVALENPDGYALHRRLCAINPRHMHHAARYTALGDDLGSRTTAPFHETAARLDALERTRAVLHLSLHGYPAQEWTRPLSGYVPSGFADWTLPCGFFLIMRHHSGRRAEGMAFLAALTAELAKNADLVAMNRAQLALREAHAGHDGTLILNDVPCRVKEDSTGKAPFTLITEYPDETIIGGSFCQAHDVQRETVIHAARLVWKGMLGS